MTVTPAGEWLTHVHVAKGVKSHLIFKLVAIITFLSIPSKYVLRLDFFNISQHNDAPLTHTLCKNHMAFSKKTPKAYKFRPSSVNYLELLVRYYRMKDVMK